MIRGLLFNWPQISDRAVTEDNVFANAGVIAQCWQLTEQRPPHPRRPGNDVCRCIEIDELDAAKTERGVARADATLKPVQQVPIETPDDIVIAEGGKNGHRAVGEVMNDAEIVTRLVVDIAQ